MTHGIKIPRGESAIKMAKGKIAKLDSDKDHKQQQEFEQKLEELVKKYTFEPIECTNIEKQAVNF